MLSSDITGSIAEHIEYTKKMVSGSPEVSACWQERYMSLADVEAYLKAKCAELDVDLSFDITAKEPLFFKTLNYTTYSGFLIIHPVNAEMALRQMADAYADGYKSQGHVDYIRRIIFETGSFSKYKVMDETTCGDAHDALVVLTGANKLKKHTCIGRLQRIVEKHGKENVLFKKHPVSHQEMYDELDAALGGGCRFAEGRESLFDLMNRTDHIYTTMLSESALIANILGKNVSHYDLFQNRELASFIHINHYIFSTLDPVSWADRSFASPKSGVIHPDVDTDWKAKVDTYLGYIMGLRDFFRDAYVWR